VTIVRVPGAWELPLIARRLASSRSSTAVIALGAVDPRGHALISTYDFAGEACCAGLAGAGAWRALLPIVFGVLTPRTSSRRSSARYQGRQQGWDAAVTAVDWSRWGRALDDAGL